MTHGADGWSPAATNRYVAALSQHVDPAVATGEVVGRVQEGLGASADVAVVFVSGAFCAAVADIVSTIHTVLKPRVLIGSTAVGVLGGAQEIEADTGLALWAGSGAPGNTLQSIQAFRLEAIPGATSNVVGFPSETQSGSLAVTLCDPFSLPIDVFVDELDGEDRGISVVGGLASAASAPGGNTLILNDGIYTDGGVGFVVPPGTARPVVSQGCRPIGSPWVVTKSEGQLIQELAGQPALERLVSLVEELSDEDRSLAAGGLHLGVVAQEHQAEFEQGDFLIRAVLGADKASGAIAVGDQVQVGQLVQFQVRDEHSASAELARLADDVDGSGALVFTCNGRGSHMFSEPSHDAALIHENVADAVAGMFCAGEIGPISGRNAMHGFTATMAVFS